MTMEKQSLIGRKHAFVREIVFQNGNFNIKTELCRTMRRLARATLALLFATVVFDMNSFLSDIMRPKGYLSLSR